MVAPHQGTGAAHEEPQPAPPDTKALCHGVAKALRRAKRCVDAPIKSHLGGAGLILGEQVENLGKTPWKAAGLTLAPSGKLLWGDGS